MSLLLIHSIYFLQYTHTYQYKCHPLTFTHYACMQHTVTNTDTINV